MPEGQVTRATLLRIMGASPGYFFQLVEVEGVAAAEGNGFGGWRIVSMPTTTPAWLDVRVGDVVTAVNGLSLEHPEDAQRVYEALRVASEIRIDLTRDGAAQTVSVTVVDSGDSAPADTAPADAEEGSAPAPEEPAAEPPAEPAPTS